MYFSIALLSVLEDPKGHLYQRPMRYLFGSKHMLILSVIAATRNS